MKSARSRRKIGFSSGDYTVNRSRVVAIQQSDIDQPKCQQCGHPISDDRMWWDGDKQAARYCSDYCRGRHRNGNIGRVMTHGLPSGREKRWAGVLAEARTVPGKEIAVSCENPKKAGSLAVMFRGKRDFDARYDGSTVFVRFVSAMESA